jgi:hypothetical protein
MQSDEFLQRVEKRKQFKQQQIANDPYADAK